MPRPNDEQPPVSMAEGRRRTAGQIQGDIERAQKQAHLDRLELIYRRFPVITRHQTSYPWAGTLIGDRAPGGGRASVYQDQTEAEAIEELVELGYITVEGGENG